MTVSSTKNSVSLTIRYSDGTNEDGTAKIKSQKYSIVSKDATDDNIYSVGKAIGGILENGAIEIKRTDDSTLNEESAVE